MPEENTKQNTKQNTKENTKQNTAVEPYGGKDRPRKVKNIAERQRAHHIAQEACMQGARSKACFAANGIAAERTMRRAPPRPTKRAPPSEHRRGQPSEHRRGQPSEHHPGQSSEHRPWPMRQY